MGNENKKIKDRIGEYLLPHIESYIFDQLSEDYLEKAGISDILKSIPIPIKKTGISGLTTLAIAQNMAIVIGCDVNFKYRDNYIAYIIRTFTKEFAKPLINEGVESAAKNDYDYACICFRAALLIDPESVDALYCYGRACRDSYETGEGEEFVGRYKAESLEAFEKLTLKRPDFDMGFYFLGYGYLNLGLYIKAKLTWETFMRLSSNDEQKREIEAWLDKLSEPVKIEEGYNMILSGRFGDGIEVLSPYEKDGRFNTWWPLWFYLGMAYKELGDIRQAEEHLLQVLKLSPSNVDAMTELIDIYKQMGESDKEKKYADKIVVVKKNMELDRAEKAGRLS